MGFIKRSTQICIIMSNRPCASLVSPDARADRQLLRYPMDFVATSRRLHLTTIVMLVIAVFSWGVQYKVSLYDIPAKKSGAVPQAKLLSQKERPLTLRESAPNDLTKPALHIPFLFLALIGCLGSLSIVPTLRRLSSRDSLPNARSDRQPHLSFFFFRPPPAPAPSR